MTDMMSIGKGIRKYRGRAWVTVSKDGRGGITIYSFWKGGHLNLWCVHHQPGCTCTQRKGTRVMKDEDKQKRDGWTGGKDGIEANGFLSGNCIGVPVHARHFCCVDPEMGAGACSSQQQTMGLV
eukprot:1881784-Ditylum_brightwellii.AAC.1